MDKVILIDFFALRIDEPMVSLTDLLVSFLCLLFFYKMHKNPTKNLSFSYFKYYFLIMGLATLFGGLLGHAFQYMISGRWKLVGWVISMVAISTAMITTYMALLLLSVVSKVYVFMFVVVVWL